MGVVKTEKQSNGQYLLEISYGGTDCPFSGIDTSASPAYIDPKSLADADGFLITDNRLVAVSIVPFTVPANIWAGVTGLTLLGAGTFYCELEQVQYNYMIGGSALAGGSIASGVFYSFFISVWNPLTPTACSTQKYECFLFDAQTPATAASYTATLIGTNQPNTGGSSQIGMVLTDVATNYTTNLSPTGLTLQNAVADFVTQWNAIAGVPATATATVDGYGIIFTAVTPGAAGNGLTLVDDSVGAGAGIPPVYYFNNVASVNLGGGMDAAPVIAPRAFTQPASITAVGGVLYIAIPTLPFILQFSTLTTSFQPATTYTGVNVLSKFAGSLIGLGVVPQLGTITQSKDMIFVWSSAEDLQEWAPETTAGLVTGAGFEQLADIADTLTGLIVSNNTAFILRTQGISYATPTGNGTEPYSIAHISLGPSGEGCQIPELICQYDQMGCYIGNSNVYGLSQSPSPIGNKIKNAIFGFLSSLPDPLPAGVANAFQYAMSSAGTGLYIAQTEDVYFTFMLGGTLYIFNGASQVWMKISFNAPGFPAEVAQMMLANFSNSSLQTKGGAFQQNMLMIAQGIYNQNTTALVAPFLSRLIEGIAPFGGGYNNQQSVTFPIEEVMFGRDINIDALYISLNAYIPSGGVELEFVINGVVYSNLELSAADYAVPLTPNMAPVLLQVMPAGDMFAAKNPQLTINIVTASEAICALWINKIDMFGSFDPAQRPV